MNGELGSKENEVEVEEEVETFASPDETVVLSEDAADLDEVSATAEVDVEKLVAKVESGDIDAAEHEKEVKRRLAEVEEQRRTEEDLDSTYNFNIDEDL